MLASRRARPGHHRETIGSGRRICIERWGLHAVRGPVMARGRGCVARAGKRCRCKQDGQ